MVENHTLGGNKNTGNAALHGTDGDLDHDLTASYIRSCMDGSALTIKPSGRSDQSPPFVSVTLNEFPLAVNFSVNEIY